MSHPKIIDDEALRRMWREGLHVRDIAHAFGCQYPAVNRRIRKLELPKRAVTQPYSGAGRETVALVAEVPTASQNAAPAPRPKAQAPTGYAAIAEDAARRGVSLAQATLDFHRARRAGRAAGGRA